MSISSGQYELNGLRRLEPQAIGALCDRYYADVYSYLRYHFARETLVEELTGRVFIQLLEVLRAGQGPQIGLNAWLLEIATAAVAEQRGQGAGAPLEVLQPYMRGLSHEQQMLLALRFGRGYTLEDTAGFMKRNVGATKQIQFRALALLNQDRITLRSNEKLYDALEACLKAQQMGEDTGAVLARFPGYHPILRGLLASAGSARSAAIREVPSGTLQRGRARVLRSAAEMRASSGPLFAWLPAWLRPPSWAQFSHWTATSVATVTFAAAGSTGLIYSSHLLAPDNTRELRVAGPHTQVGDKALEMGAPAKPVRRAAPNRVVADPSSSKAPAPQPKKPAPKKPVPPSKKPVPPPKKPPKAPPPHPHGGGGDHDHHHHRRHGHR